MEEAEKVFDLSYMLQKSQHSQILPALHSPFHANRGSQYKTCECSVFFNAPTAAWQRPRGKRYIFGIVQVLAAIGSNTAAICSEVDTAKGS